MPQAETLGTGFATTPSGQGSERVLRTPLAPPAKGVLIDDDRIAAVARDFLEALGFAPNDDLRGLAVASFWHHEDRPAVLAALRRARSGEDVQITLDLAYLKDGGGVRTVAIGRADGSGLVMMTVVA